MVGTRTTPHRLNAAPTGWKAALRKALLAKRGGPKLKTKGELRAEAAHSGPNGSRVSQSHSAYASIRTYKRKRQLRLQINEHDDLHRAVIDMSPFAVSAINRASENFSLPKQYLHPPTPDVALKCLEFICAQVPRISPTASCSGCTKSRKSITPREEEPMEKRRKCDDSSPVHVTAFGDSNFIIKRGDSNCCSSIERGTGNPHQGQEKCTLDNDSGCISDVESEQSTEDDEMVGELELGVGEANIMQPIDIQSLEVIFGSSSGIDLGAMMIDEEAGLLYCTEINDGVLDSPM